MNRTALAALISPWALPLSYACVLAAYVKRDPFEAAPLLPGHLAMVLMLAYVVTLFIGVPLWLALSARWAVSIVAAAMSGAAVGLLVATVFRRTEPQLFFPAGFLEWVGGIGGLLCALIFRLIAGGNLTRRLSR